MTEHAPTIRGLKHRRLAARLDRIRQVTEHAPTIRGLKRDGSYVLRFPMVAVTEHAPTIRGLKHGAVPTRLQHRARIM